MAPLDFLASPLRSLLGVAEHAESDVSSHAPMHETRELERQLSEAVAAVHRSSDSLERHVAVLETLADSLAPLTESVTRLTDQLSPLLKIAAPLGSAEREVSRVEHFFGRRRRSPQAPAEPGAPEAGAPEPPVAT
jgi:hypothetical protein